MLNYWKCHSSSIVMEGGNELLLHLKLFQHVVEHFISDLPNVSDVEISEALLLADNVRVTYDTDSLVLLE